MIEIKGIVSLYDSEGIKGDVCYIMVKESDIDDELRNKLGRGTPMTVSNDRLKYRYGKTDIFSY